MEIPDPIKEIYRQWLWVLDHHPHQTFADKPIRAICNALRDMTARAMKSEAFLVWIMSGKKGPSPSVFLESWQADAHRLLMGEEPPK